MNKYLSPIIGLIQAHSSQITFHKRIHSLLCPLGPQTLVCYFQVEYTHLGHRNCPSPATSSSDYAGNIVDPRYRDSWANYVPKRKMGEWTLPRTEQVVYV